MHTSLANRNLTEREVCTDKNHMSSDSLVGPEKHRSVTVVVESASVTAQMFVHLFVVAAKASEVETS